MTVFTYILKWTICLALLYIPFALLLRKETFVSLNRKLLLGIVIVSSLLPLLTIHYTVEIKLPAFEAIENFESVAEIGNDTENRSDSISTFETITIIYLAGVVASLLWEIAGIARIKRAINAGCIWKEKRAHYTIHCHANDTAPFSWFGHIVISEDDYTRYGKEILLHEEGHINHHHSCEMLFISIARRLQWFNPFIYMLKNDLKEIHEYEADRYVIEHGCDKQAYQLLLLRKAIGNSNFTLANNFGQSSIRNRIKMIAGKESKRWKKSKYIYIIPAIAFTALIQAKPVYVYSTITQDSCITTEREADITKEEQKLMATVVTTELKTIKTEHKQPIQKKIAIQAKERRDTTIVEPAKHIAEDTAQNEKLQYTLEQYYEYISIDENHTTGKLAHNGVNKCSIRMQFRVDCNGMAYSITPGGCNVSIKGKQACNDPSVIEDIKRFASQIATEHIADKVWPAIDRGKNSTTIYDAHIIFHHGKSSIIASNDTSRPLLVGLTPIE